MTARKSIIWPGLACVLLLPVFTVAASPLLAWRDPIYIAASFAGVVAFGLLIVQPLLAKGFLPGMSAVRGRYMHRITGGLLVGAVIAHVAALWITSPPDVIDALTFTSPTPFSSFGVVAMWAVFATALLAGLRRRMRLSLTMWRGVHIGLAATIVIGTVAHTALIDGTLNTASKLVLSMAALALLLTTLNTWRRH